MEKEDKKIIHSTIAAMIIMFLLGIVFGCFILFVCNKEAIRHYNECQEEQLIKKLSESRDEKQWYIKEDAFGKIKLIQFSENQLDSLQEITAKEE